MRTSLRTLTAAALLFTVAAAPLAAKRAPDQTFKTLNGQKHKLSELRGRIVVLNFWATWCGPCQEELPRLMKLASAYTGKPVTFVLVSVDQAKDQKKIPAALERLHVAEESWVGADADTMEDFGLRNIVPGTVILDDQGQIVTRIMGEAHEEDVRGPVDWLLGGKKGPAPEGAVKRY